MAVDNKADTLSTAEQTTSSLINAVLAKSQHILDGFIPPQLRRQAWHSISAFAHANPKLSAFILANLLLSSGPLALFALFASATMFTALLTALFCALAATLLIAGFLLSIACFVLLPTLVVTTVAATCAFGWAVAGYWVLQRVREGRAGDGAAKVVRSTDASEAKEKTAQVPVAQQAVKAQSDVEGSSVARSDDGASSSDAKWTEVMDVPAAHGYANESVVASTPSRTLVMAA